MARLQLRPFASHSRIVTPPSGSTNTVRTCSCSSSSSSSRAASTLSQAARNMRLSPQAQAKVQLPVQVRSNSSVDAASRQFTTATPKSSAWPARANHQHASTVSAGKQKETQLASIPSPPRSKTIADIHALKHHAGAAIPIVCLTAHDYPSALSIRSAHVDLCLIGDSLANVALGLSSTQPLSLDAMIHHCNAVKRGLDAPLFSAAALLEGVTMPDVPLVIADVPFGATLGSVDSGVAAVVRLIQQTGVDGVKIEGSYDVVPLIQRLTQHGIPVMGHVGLQPQRVGSTSGYRVQGKTAQHAKHILDASLALQHAGCFSIVLECIPTRLGEHISRQLAIPTVGIGAGSKTDGQILVMNDMIADLTGAAHVLAALAHPQTLTQSRSVSSDSIRAMLPAEIMPATSPLTPSPPKFVRNFCTPQGASIGALRIAAVQAYTKAVRDRTFPDDANEGYKINSQEWKAFLELC